MRNLDLFRDSFSPFRDGFRDSNNLARLMDQMFESPTRIPNNEKYSWNPSCEAHEDETTYHLKFDLPGVPKDSIKIDLHDNRLSVSGERKEEKSSEDKDRRTHFSEVFYGSFTRTMTFPTPVDGEKTEAKYENGVLTVKVNKKTANSARQILIK